MSVRGQEPMLAPDAKGLVGAGYRIVRVRTETKCKCCDGTVRDTVERWELLRHLGQNDESGAKVTLHWMVDESLLRFGERISENSFKGHRRNHMEILRDTTIRNPNLTEAEATREAIPEVEQADARHRAREGGYEPGSHQRFLEEVVQMGRARIRANPAAVTVDHALAAAKELSRLKQDENRAELIRALAQAGAVRIGKPEVQRALEEAHVADVAELVET